MHLKCILLVAFVVSSTAHDFEGNEAKRTEPLTRRKMVRCFDENVKYLGPKSFEVEKHKRKEETKTSIIREKRSERCTVETLVTDDVPSEIDAHSHRHRHRHHHRHQHDEQPKNFNTKTSYSISKSVTSPPVERNFNTRHSSSSDSEISSHGIADENYSSPESLPTIPHLPAIPHIGHEATYPIGEEILLDQPQENSNARDTEFGGEEPGPGEKTISFKTNTRRHETVDQTGFVREKSNGYPIRPNDDWKARFNDIPYMVDDKGKVISSAASSSFHRNRFVTNNLLVVLVLLLFPLIRNTLVVSLIAL